MTHVQSHFFLDSLGTKIQVEVSVAYSSEKMLKAIAFFVLKFNFLTVCEIFFKLKFSKFFKDIRTLESFGKFLLIVIYLIEMQHDSKVESPYFYRLLVDMSIIMGKSGMLMEPLLNSVEA